MKVSGYHITIGNATDVGRQREQNEDYMAHFDTPSGYCIIVCDGMGGHAAGQVASQNAVASLQHFLQDPKNDHSSVLSALKNAIEFANFQLREMVNQNPALKGMGTTCVLALIKDGQLYTAHAGDSRMYIVRKNGTEQITKDHSSVQELIDIGVLTEEEAEFSDKKNQISKAIGVFDKVDPSISESFIGLHKNDKLLLCTDGLTGHVGKEKISETILTAKDVQTAALKLIELANNGGGSDNITVQVVHYTGKTIRNKKKRTVKKRIALIFLAFALVAFGFIGFRKLGTNSNQSPASSNSDTTTAQKTKAYPEDSIKKKDTGNTDKKSRTISPQQSKNQTETKLPATNKTK